MKDKQVASLTILVYGTLRGIIRILPAITQMIRSHLNHRILVSLTNTNAAFMVSLLCSSTVHLPNMVLERVSDGASPQLAAASRNSGSPSMRNADSLSHEASSSSMYPLLISLYIAYLMLRTRSSISSKCAFTRTERHPGCVHEIHSLP